MPCVGERKTTSMGDFSKSPMYEYAARFCDTQKAIFSESQVDYCTDPVRATAFPASREALKEFYLENSVIDPKDKISTEDYEDQMKMMKEFGAFIKRILMILFLWIIV